MSRLAWFFAALLAFNAAAADASDSARLNATFDGVACEYAPGQHELARALAARFAQHNLTAAPDPAALPPEDASIPFTPADLKENRARYLARIAALLALKEPTSLQAEGYDAYAELYGALMHHRRTLAATVATIRRITIWSRSQLIDRLGSGVPLAGFAYDPATKAGRATYGQNLAQSADEQQAMAAAQAKRRLQYSLAFATTNGVTSHHGQFGPSPTATSAPDPGVPTELTDAFPVVIPDEWLDLPPDALAAKLWNGAGDRSLVHPLAGLVRMAGAPAADPVMVFTILHEVAETGIVEHYFRGPDRRWFCDGVANYVAWRVLRDLHGEAAAAQAHDLPSQLIACAPFHSQVDLRKWPAAEQQAAADQDTPLNRARYIFAERAVVLMNERAGPDILPKLFAEIGRTKRDKVSMKTIEKAWSKVTGGKLDSVLAAATQSPSAPESR